MVKVLRCNRHNVVGRLNDTHNWEESLNYRRIGVEMIDNGHIGEEMGVSDGRNGAARGN